jgi:hypothetical protein
MALSMRTFPKSLAALRKMVEQRGEQFRMLSFDELLQLGDKPSEHLTVDSRPATISIIMHAMPNGSLRVVVRGSMKARFLPGSHIALDGFYKPPDGAVSPMPNNEFYEFD